MRMDGWIDRHKHYGANSSFSKFSEITKKRKTRVIFDIVHKLCMLISSQNNLEACNSFHYESKLKQ